jgi:Ca2+-binding EF-hand superfamily protein
VVSNVSLSSTGSVKTMKTVSLDIDPNTASQTRLYPSVRDYYKSSCVNPTKPIQLQHGLSNYSSLILGDDRISFSESILSATYRVAVEDKLTIESPSKVKTKQGRRREYQEAHEKVGVVEINRLEKVMKDKLIQRSYITSSPFQVRKAFKFFDQEQKMRIHIEGFTRALEFLGFQFSEMQNLALFAKYDTECTGEIDYMNFIKTAMFYAPNYTGQDPKRATAPSPAPAHDDLYQVPDIGEEEVINGILFCLCVVSSRKFVMLLQLKQMQRRELSKLFNKIDRAGSGEITRDQFELLLMAVGHNVSFSTIDSYWSDLGIEPNGNLTFDLFFEWWTSPVGCVYVPSNSRSGSPARASSPKSMKSHK